jgi:hypothetical protein
MDLCPVCGEEYVDVLRGDKVTIPLEYDDCHKSVQLAGGGTVGRWYLHE